jgi:hypothetical protein
MMGLMKPTRTSELGLIGALIMMLGSAHVLAAPSLVDPGLALPESAFAAMVATAVTMVCGRFPI